MQGQGHKVKYEGSNMNVQSARSYKKYTCEKWTLYLFCSNVMVRIKAFHKYVKLQGQGHQVKFHGTALKVLLQGMQMWNMKALPLLVRKLQPRLVFFK